MSSPVFADLHMHSSASDGELSPAELVRQASQASLGAMAITDHDTLAGIPEAAAEGQRLGIEVIPGCEMSAYSGSQEIHILALFIDPSRSKVIEKVLERGRAERPVRVLKMAERLRALGLAISDEDILAAASKAKSPGRTHVASALMKKGFVSSVSEAFKRYLNPGAPAYVEKLKLTPEEVVAAIHGSGAVAILAHPGHYYSDDSLLRKLLSLVDGIEAFHSSHSPDQRKLFTEMASKAGRLITGGSDFHGPKTKPGVLIGSSGIAEPELELLRNRRNQSSSPLT